VALSKAKAKKKENQKNHLQREIVKMRKSNGEEGDPYSSYVTYHNPLNRSITIHPFRDDVDMSNADGSDAMDDNEIERISTHFMELVHEVGRYLD
jgi:hypothetical protein